MNYYFKALKSAFDFSSRARRKEFWMFTFINFLVVIAIVTIEIMAGLYDFDRGYGILTGIYNLVLFIPALAISVRRLHDTNKSGWFLLVNLIPVIGSIIILVFCCKEGDQGTNKYGPNPKANENALRYTV